MRRQSREELIKRLIDDNPLVQEAMRIEPEIGQIIEEVKIMKNRPGYNRVVTRSRMKQRLYPLVGWYAGEKLTPSKGSGFRPIGEFVEEARTRLKKLQTGELSHPLKTQAHWNAVINVVDQLLPSDDGDREKNESFG